MKKAIGVFIFLGHVVTACISQPGNNTRTPPSASVKDANGSYPLLGTIEKFHASLDKIIQPGTVIEKVAEGFLWSEGPLWVPAINSVLLSDVPANTIYSWNEKDGLNVWLTPSGYTGEGTYSREPGSNGLLLDAKGRLVLCQHGDRRMARMVSAINAPAPKFETLAGSYQEIRFNSPNDGAYDKQGNLYFTDPPYGLPANKDQLGPLHTWNGVYKVKADGKVILLLDSLSRPNGIAVFPNGKSILVANSDPKKPFLYQYDIKGDALVNGKIFFDATGMPSSYRGLCDGLKIDSRGFVFASGPGGIYIFDSKGQKLGLIRLTDPASNVALSKDEKTLYITNNKFLLRVKMRP